MTIDIKRNKHTNSFPNNLYKYMTCIETKKKIKIVDHCIENAAPKTLFFKSNRFKFNENIK